MVWSVSTLICAAAGCLPSAVALSVCQSLVCAMVCASGGAVCRLMTGVTARCRRGSWPSQEGSLRPRPATCGASSTGSSRCASSACGTQRSFRARHGCALAAGTPAAPPPRLTRWKARGGPACMGSAHTKSARAKLLVSEHVARFPARVPCSRALYFPTRLPLFFSLAALMLHALSRDGRPPFCSHWASRQSWRRPRPGRSSRCGGASLT